MRIGLKIPYYCALLALLMVSAACPAQENSAMVLAARGEVSVISNGESRPLKQGDFIAVNDEINAAGRSFAVVQFFDGAKVSLRPDSSFVIEQFRYGAGGEDSATLRLVSGGLKLVPGAIAGSNPDSFRIRTPWSLLASSGAEGSVSLCDDSVCDQKGLVEVPE